MAADGAMPPTGHADAQSPHPRSIKVSPEDGWRRKSLEEPEEAYAEIRRPRAGRKARVRRAVETVADPAPRPPL